MDYLIMMLEKYLYFRKRKTHLARTFFSHPMEVTGSMYFGNIFQIRRFSKTCTNLERNLNNSGCIKVDNFRKPVNF